MEKLLKRQADFYLQGGMCGKSLPVHMLIKKMLETTNPYNKGNTVDMAKFYELEKKFT